MNEVRLHSMPASEETKKATDEVIEQSKQLFVVSFLFLLINLKKKVTTNEEGEEVEEVSGPVGNVPDVLADSKTW
jgi:hypothetical protein